MRRVVRLLLFILLAGTCHPSRAQDFRECQNLYQKLLVQFNQSFEKNDPKILQSAAYRHDLIALQKSFHTYHKAHFSTIDSAQKSTNEALLLVLSGNYSKGLRLLNSLESLDDQTKYYQGLLQLLNKRFSEATLSLQSAHTDKWAGLNALVAAARAGRTEEALALGTTIAHGNTQGKWNYNVGLLYKKQGQYEESIRELSTAIKQKDQMAYRLMRGDVLMRTKQAKRAVSDFEKVAKHHSKAQIRYGNALIELNRFRDASYVFEQYLEKNERTFRKDAFLGLGHAYYGLSQFEKALRYYRLAATMIRNSPVALCGQANVLVTQHEYEAAQSIYNRILSGDSTYLSAQLGRGLSWYGLGKYEKALKDFEKVKSLFDESDRRLADLFVSRGYSFYYTGKAGEALSDFQTAARLDGTRYEALAGISSVMIDQKSYSEAGRYLSKALNHHKTYDKMWSNYGNLLLHFDMHSKGYDVFKKAIALNPENIKAHNGWGVVLLENDELNKSKVLFDSLVGANPGLPYLLNNRGIVHAYHGNRHDQLGQPIAADSLYQLAENDFQSALEVAPARKFYNVNLGNVYRYWEDYEEAKLTYQIHQDKSALNNIAILYAGQENMMDAKYYLETALQLDSAHRVFQFNMNLLMKGKQKEFAKSLASTVASMNDGLFSDIGIKYSRDGFVTLYLYDYEYDTLHFPGRHFLPFPIAEYNEDYFIPEFNFKLVPYSEKKIAKIKKRKYRYKEQKVKLKGSRRRSGTRCPVFYK